jgi:Uma2 family endonuclease
MTTAAATATLPAPKSPLKKKEEKRITWEQFQKNYLQREDRWKYEWVNGIVEKTPRRMDQLQQIYFINLQEWLDKLRTPQRKLGKLLSEVDTFFKESHRRPDIAYFSEEQIAAIPKGNQVPQFVIEIISSNDQMNLVHKKMRDYRNAEVPVVWHVFPDLQEVHVYTGDNMAICRGDKLCSAEPVIPGFNIPDDDIFNFGQ